MNRIKEERERGKGVTEFQRRRNRHLLCTRSTGQTFQDSESFLELLTSENKIWAAAEEQTVRPRGQSSPSWLTYLTCLSHRPCP